jgi:hypothetical protein
LVRKAGYTIGSRELMNYFLKGLKIASDIMEQVVKKFPNNYQDLKAKTIAIVKARQLLQAMRASSDALFFQRPQPQFDNCRGPLQFNFSNAPCTINNVLVPMTYLGDASYQTEHPTLNQQCFRGNVTQVEEPF